MNKRFTVKELEPLITEALSKGATFTMIPRGVSMLPLIREGVDSVVLSAIDGEVSEGDIILYKRSNGSYVLHRVMKKSGSSFTMCGDNQYIFERGICREQMLARASALIRDGKEIDLFNNKEYISYSQKILKEKKRKNIFTLPKRILKRILSKIFKK